MTIEKDISEFNSWANSLGIPSEILPDHAAMKTMFMNSRQSNLFFNMMQKVQPKQKVELIRKNILISKMAKLKDQIIPSCQLSFTPKELQRHVKMKELENENAKIEISIKQAKEKCKQMKKIIKTQNVQKLKMTLDRDNLFTKAQLIELKLDTLQAQKQKELENREKIISIMPVKSNFSNSSDTLASSAIFRANKELKEFYKIYQTSYNNSAVEEANNEMWKQLREIFKNIPNSSLWQNILKIKEDQIQSLKNLNNTNNSMPVTKNQKITPFDIQLMRTKSSIVTLVQQYVSSRCEKDIINREFTSAFNEMVDSFQEKIKTFSSDSAEDSDVIISNFLIQYNIKNYNKAKYDYLIEEIERLKKNIKDGHRNVLDHAILTGSLKEMYNEINFLVHNVKEEISQLSEIKNKIQYSRVMLGFMLKDIQANRQHKITKSKLSPSLLSVESFEISDAICSTKLDFDCTSSTNTTQRSDSTMASVNLSPSIINELQVLLETPIDKFNFMNKKCTFYLDPNPVIFESLESFSTLKFCPGTIYTAEGSFQQIQQKIQWHKKLAEVSNQLKVEVQPVEVDHNQIELMKRKQHEDVNELLHEIISYGCKTNKILTRGFKYYDFLINNSFKNYIPSSKHFNNQSFADYEAEYLMYYRIATAEK